MKNEIEIDDLIARPIETVDKGLIEVLGVYADIGKLKNLKPSLINYKYCAQIENEILCRRIRNAGLTVCLESNSNLKPTTHLNFIITYEPNNILAIQHYWYRLIYMPIIRLRIQHIIADFKYRVEKWM